MVLQALVSCRPWTAVWTGQCALGFLGCRRRQERTAMLLLMGRVWVPARETIAFCPLACAAHAGQGKSRNGHHCFFLWHLKMSTGCSPLPRELIQLTFQFSSWDFLDVLFRGTSPFWFYLSLSKMGKSRWTSTDNADMEGIWSDRSKVRLGAEGGHWRFLEALPSPSLKWERK